MSVLSFGHDASLGIELTAIEHIFAFNFTSFSMKICKNLYCCRSVASFKGLNEKVFDFFVIALLCGTSTQMYFMSSFISMVQVLPKY